MEIMVFTFNFCDGNIDGGDYGCISISTVVAFG